MEYNLNMNIEQKQELNMTPQLRMAIRLLQYSTIEVKGYLEDMVQENPLLETKEGRIGENQNYSGNGHNFNYENMISKKRNFIEYIEDQLFQCLSKGELKIGRYIVGNLDKQGFLKTDNRIIADRFQIDTEVVENIIRKIQQLDPPGIAARDFRESLLIQLDMLKEESEIERIIINKYIRELAAGNLEIIADKLKVSKPEIKQAVNKIKKLNPYPTSGFYQGEETKYIIPDLIIKKLDGEFILQSNSILPELKINNYYYKLLSKCNNKEELKYLKERYQSACWLIKSIEQRQNTISKIAKAIIKKQSDFLNKGVRFLYTMTLNEIARVVDVHESTVSRAVKEKYIQTPQGLYELRFFFNSGIGKLSSPGIKSFIEEFIQKENSKSPLSDKKIAFLLSRRLNIDIARRTVSKYRNEMGLLSSNKRRRQTGL